MRRLPPSRGQLLNVLASFHRFRNRRRAGPTRGHFVGMDLLSLISKWNYTRHSRDLPQSCPQCGTAGSMIAVAIDARLERLRCGFTG